MKEGWQIKKLGEICELLNGFAFKSNEYAKDGIRVIRITNVQKGKIVDEEPKFFPEERISEISKYILQDGDLLISLTGNVGRVGILFSSLLPAALNQRVACIRTKDKTVSIKYLFYLLNSNLFEKDCISNASGIAQLNMSTKWLEQYKIVIPPTFEQQRIVNLLDAEFAKIDILKSNAEKNLQNTKNLFQAALKKELEPKNGWTIKPLNQVIDAGSHISYGIVQPEEDTPDGVPIVRPMDLTSEILTSTENFKKTKKSISESYQRSVLKGTEILLCVRGTTGVISLSSMELKGCNTTRGIVPLCISNDITRRYVYYVLRSEPCQKYISEYTNGTALKQINIADVKNIPIATAPYNEQVAIIERLDTFTEKSKTLQANYERTIALCDDLKQTLLRKAFNGEL